MATEVLRAVAERVGMVGEQIITRPPMASLRAAA
jgi:hypothetical protein